MFLLCVEYAIKNKIYLVTKIWKDLDDTNYSENARRLEYSRLYGGE